MRRQKHSRVLEAVLGPEASKAAGKLDPSIKQKLRASVVAEFSKWREGASPDKFYTGRNAAFKRAAALIASTPKSRQIQVLLRYWRLAWDAAGEQLKRNKNPMGDSGAYTARPQPRRKAVANASELYR
jgi:hypothetical protein